MPRALTLAAIGEVATGLALLLAPSLVVRLLLGAVPSGEALVIARVAGIAIIGLGIACWPGPPTAGMVVYSVSVALGLAYLGLTGMAAGFLLWPAVLVHSGLTAAMLWPIVWAREHTG